MIQTEAFEALASSSKGIAKLRQLILELAVRGLLMPQDPNDEPASVLLEKITAEKQRLVKDGKIKKQQIIPPVDPDKILHQVPISWSLVRWDSIAMKIGDIDHKMPETVTDGVPYVSPRDFLPGNRIDFENAKRVSHEDFVRLSAKIKPEPGDLIYPRYGTIGENRLVEDNLDFLASYSCCVIKVLNGFVDPKYQYIFSISTFCRQQAKSAENRTTQANVGIKSIQEFIVPLPPLAEQERIVSKVDELMALCDQLEQHQNHSNTVHQRLLQTLLESLTQAVDHDAFQKIWSQIAAHFDTLFTTEASVDQLKQVILQLAVMGKLVPQDPNDEPASVLLEKIAEEKARLVKEGKIKSQQSIANPAGVEKMFRLPTAWQWCNLNNLITIMDAGWSPACLAQPSTSEDEWAILKTTAVQVMKFEQHENKLLPKDKSPKPQYEVAVGDILITRAGPKNRVGISCLVDSTRPKLMISDKIIRFHLVSVGLSERYISLCLNAGATADFIEKSKSGMAESQMNISQDKLKMAPIPLPPINEQHRIVAKVDELMNLCDQLKSRLNKSQQTQEHLATAIVEKAVA